MWDSLRGEAFRLAACTDPLSRGLRFCRRVARLPTKLAAPRRPRRLRPSGPHSQVAMPSFTDLRPAGGKGLPFPASRSKKHKKKK